MQLLNVLTKGASNRAVFSVYRSSFLDPLAYLRCVCHVFGHANWNHLMGNMMYILILGPMLEEKYGTSNMVFIMLVTALATGLANLIFFPNIRLLGASGIVFAMILLSSITITEEHTIPLSFILVAAIYIGQQAYQGLFTADNISQMAHIVGGIIGSVLGFVMNKYKMRRGYTLCACANGARKSRIFSGATTKRRVQRVLSLRGKSAIRMSGS